MELIQEHQELVDFFTGRILPSGPQHVNSYSVFLNLDKAVKEHLKRLQSERETTRLQAAILLQEVKHWLLNSQSISAQT